MWSWSPPVFPNFVCNTPRLLLFCQKRGFILKMYLASLVIFLWVLFSFIFHAFFYCCYGNTFQDWRSEKAVLCDSSSKVEFFQILYNTADFFITLEWIFVITALPFPPMENVFQFFGTSSPSFLGSVKIESIRWLLFFRTYSMGSYHSWAASPLHKTSRKIIIFLTICVILNILFILGFILFKHYFYASSLDSWMFCSAHSLPPFLKGFSTQCWIIFAW